MYPVDSSKYDRFTVYDLDKDRELHFNSLDALLEFIAKHSIYSPETGDCDFNTVLEEINLTGSDTQICQPGLIPFRCLRPYIIVDGAGRYINPWDFAEIIDKKRKQPSNTVRCPVKYPNCRYRVDPVPQTGIGRKKCRRENKRWFRSYRLDRLPEYAPYARKKATLPHDGYILCRNVDSRSWKHNTTRKHQWKPNRVDSDAV